MKKVIIFVVTVLISVISAKAQFIPELMMAPDSKDSVAVARYNQYLTMEQVNLASKIKVDKTVMWTGVGITTAGSLITILAAAEVFDRADWPWVVGPTLAGCGAITATVGAILSSSNSRKLKRITMAKNGFVMMF